MPDRKLTKAELILGMRRDNGQLAALLGLSSNIVSSMDQHREFNEVFDALDCQRGSRSVITFDEFREYVDGQYRLQMRVQLALMAAAVVVVGLILLSRCYQTRARQQREHDKSN